MNVARYSKSHIKFPPEPKRAISKRPTTGQAIYIEDEFGKMKKVVKFL